MGIYIMLRNVYASLDIPRSMLYLTLDLTVKRSIQNLQLRG